MQEQAPQKKANKREQTAEDAHEEDVAAGGTKWKEQHMAIAEQRCLSVAL